MKNKVREKIKNTFRLKKAVNLVWQGSKKLFLIRLILLIFQGVFPLIPLYMMKLFIDMITKTAGSTDKTADFSKIILFIVLMGIVALIIYIIRSLSGFVSTIQSQVVTDKVYDILHSKSIEVDLEYYENPKYFDTLHRAQQEAPYRPTHIVNGLVQTLQNSISLIAMAGLLFSFHWFFAVILFLAVLPTAWVRVKYSGKMFGWQRSRTPAERKAWYYSGMITRKNHAKEIRIFNLGELFQKRFSVFRKTLREERLKIIGKRTLAEFFSQIIGIAVIFISLIYIAYKTIHGNITLGDMVMYYGAFQRGQGYLKSVLQNLAGLYEDNLFLTYMYDFLDIKPKIKLLAGAKIFPEKMKKGIIFDNIDFSYPLSERKALENISLTVNPSEVIALVGENGSGKTTLVKLLCRLYDPINGIIKIEEEDLRNFDIISLRNNISIIFQDYAKYYISAKENIWFGNTNFSSEDKRIFESAKISGADFFLQKLTDGYETILGKWFEKGEELSIGEWQKIALARALFSDSKIIVLDEPTSALDAKSEFEVFEKFKIFAEDKMVILISHRFSTVRLADRIYVMDTGKIIEEGTHKQLLELNGKYANLFKMQAKHYQ